MNMTNFFDDLRTKRPLCALSLGLLVLIGVSACGDKSDAPVATQVAAKVGSNEISVHQINQVLSRTPSAGDSKDAVKSASEAALERLIDQQLAVDQAIEMKLHRSPDVVAKLEAARRDVLARAYLEQLSQSVTRPTTDEVKKYYDENPALFSERRIFTFQELRIPNAGPALDEIRSLAEKGSSLEEVAGALRARQVPFSAGGGSRNAEQLPMDMLPRLHALKDGQNMLVVTGENATLLRVAASKSSPVSLDIARPGIEQFLNNRRTSETIVSDIKRLRAATPIEYEGDFAKVAASAAESGQPAPAAAQPEPPALSAPAESTGDRPGLSLPDASQIERGLQGLK
jgi:EpsD family peptidyl-prolyl cis-trans isomerase